MAQITGPDAEKKPFGALVHMDWIEVKRHTPASRSAKRALIITDDITRFMGGFPSNWKNAEVVIEAVHRFDEIPPEIRRWWTDRAAELLKASRIIRAQRPLAHFVSIPWRHAPRAERSNRTVTEGARSVLIQSGLSEAWWPLAMMHCGEWPGNLTPKTKSKPFQRK